MLSSTKKPDQKGFTIIEVLIVLAIAGLIMLVVFLAVPALQRNARNTQRNNDVASILAAVNNFMNNHNGTLPNSLSVAADRTLTVTHTTVAGVSPITTKLGYYDAGTVTWGTGAIPGTNGTTADSVVVYGRADCNSVGTTAITGPSRSVAANFTLETDVKQCKAS